MHNKRLPWQYLRLMRIVDMCKMTPTGVRLSLKNFLLIPCVVMELLRKVSLEGRIAPPPRSDRVKSKSYQKFVFTKEILRRFVSFCISLIFTYCLFVEKKLVTIEILLSSHLKPQKWALFYYFQNISINCHFVTHFDPPKNLRKKMLIVTNFFPQISNM